MSRQLIRILGKKRGSRQTVSTTFGSVGNLAFSLTLLLLGLISGIQLLTNLTGDVSTWLLAIVVLSFVVFGAQGLISEVLRSRVGDELKYSLQQNVQRLDITQKARASRKLPHVPPVDTLLNSPGAIQRWRLPVTSGKPVEVISVIIFFAIWTLVSIFLLIYSINQYLAEDHSGWSWWLPTLSLLPAMGIALWSGRMLLQELRNQINIDPLRVEISHQPIYPGETYDIAISQRGTLHVRSLRLFLVCEEITSYHQGTDIRTETLETFRKQVFVQRRFEITAQTPLSEVFTVTIPSDAMHSFQANFNCVQWKLISVARYRELLEIRRGYSLIVHPPFQDESEEQP